VRPLRNISELRQEVALDRDGRDTYEGRWVERIRQIFSLHRGLSRARLNLFRDPALRHLSAVFARRRDARERARIRVYSSRMIGGRTTRSHVGAINRNDSIECAYDVL
jgi:hypothetical protein